MIRVKAETGKVLINLNTLKFYTCAVYIKKEFEKYWIQINKADIKAFISEQKAQIETSAEASE